MKRWTVHLDGGPRRVNHAAVAIQDKIYSFGGYCTGEDYENILPMDVHVLCTVTFRWKLLPTELTHCTPYQRYGHSAVAYGDDGFVWGGRSDHDGACNRLYKYCPNTGRWSQVVTNGVIPDARDGHSACVIRDKMYIFGGYEDRNDRFSNDVYSFAFSTSTWTLLKQYGTSPRWRDFHTAIGIGADMYVFGGRGDLGGDMFTNREVYCNKIMVFNTDTCTWEQPVVHGDLPVGRRSHSVFTHQGKMYIFGGYNGEELMHLNDIYEYNPEKCEWSLVHMHGERPCARRRHCCCKVAKKVFLFGGTSPSSNHYIGSVEGVELSDLSDLHILDLEPSLKTLAQMAVIKHKLDTSGLPRDLRWELAAITTPNVITRSANSNG